MKLQTQNFLYSQILASIGLLVWYVWTCLSRINFDLYDLRQTSHSYRYVTMYQFSIIITDHKDIFSIFIMCPHVFFQVRLPAANWATWLQNDTFYVYPKFAYDWNIWNIYHKQIELFLNSCWHFRTQMLFLCPKWLK